MLKTIDLFAGAGGLSLGFKQTGHFKLVAAAEIKKYARETYRNNISEKGEPFEFIEDVIGYDFKALSDRLGGIDVVIGGPPCQGFSNANRQKTRLISMNNALVKEYFRAIKEIRPKAFVMENVSMLKSSVHRFYDSKVDSDMINKLNEPYEKSSKPLIPMREDKIVISARVYDGFDMKDIAENRERLAKALLSADLFQMLNVLNKNISNDKRLPKYIEKHGRAICSAIDRYCASEIETEESKLMCKWMKKIRELLCDANEKLPAIPELESIIEFQKSLRTIREIYDNQLIGKYSIEDGTLIYTVKSYAVIDYVNAILGGEYIQHGATLNAVCFGVPQERKRHIVIGIRKDCLKTKDFTMLSNPDVYKKVTVGDAISDLAEYDVSTDSDCVNIPYVEQENLSEYAMLMRENSVTVKNHFTTSTTETAKKRFEIIGKGKNFQSLPDELKTTYTKPERTQKTIYLRLDPCKPSGTVVNVRKSMWIHPEISRAITLREAARLQSFPDSFEFKGTKDSQYQQVGNAVPPMLAWAIAEHLYGIIGE